MSLPLFPVTFLFQLNSSIAMNMINDGNISEASYGSFHCRCAEGSCSKRIKFRNLYAATPPQHLYRQQWIQQTNYRPVLDNPVHFGSKLDSETVCLLLQLFNIKRTATRYDWLRACVTSLPIFSVIIRIDNHFVSSWQEKKRGSGTRKRSFTVSLKEWFYQCKKQSIEHTKHDFM